MKNKMRVIIAVMILLVTLLSSASAETVLSDMSIAELSDLRDQITQEINNRTLPQSVITIDGDTSTIEITSFEEGGKKEVNDYYDLYKPGIGTSDDYRRFIFFFTITNKGDKAIDKMSLEDVSINGWMTSGYVGVREIATNKRAKGFANISLLNCDAESIEDVQSVEFEIELKDDNRAVIEKHTVQFVRSGDSFVLVQ
ncbi:MAG: hypothetical protein PUG73_11360 [Pseudomonadota bacterium]|nr:hypothetical protein [Pseudomonadota bacterium]